MSFDAADDAPAPGESRRSFLKLLPTATMVAALAGAYGTLAAFMGRFLFPEQNGGLPWKFVTDVKSLGEGQSLVYRTPAGAAVAVARQGAAPTAESFVALSSTCPHLGCQVHWEAQNSRFFCPCHNGAFDPSGKAIAGPPADAGQSLVRFPVKVENGLLFIQVPEAELSATANRPAVASGRS